MENLYYTPDITEFHIGFECEVNNDPRRNDTWEPFLIESYRDLRYTTDPDSDGDYRVKYLDKEDLRNLGWEFTKDGFDAKFGLFRIHFDEVWDTQSISICKLDALEKNEWVVFCGNIKNKSEFARLMRQLKIKTNG